jgi:hypothetical protein
MAANYKLNSFAGYDDYYKSLDFGVGSELKRDSILNSDQYLFNVGVQNYYLDTPRVLTKHTKFIPDLSKKSVKQ